MKRLLIGILILTLYCDSFSQPFTKKYIMSFHVCDASCSGFQDHLVSLAESDNGTDWTLVPNFTPYNGSVPDVIVRGNKLYLYTPGNVKRYNNSTGNWDANTTLVTIKDSAGGIVQFVDPSAIVDSAGNILLFFLNSTGNPMGQDPAGCQTYPCVKYFDSAIEVAGSDGSQFIKQSGHRVAMVLQSATASDPDIFYDGNNYIMYISKGTNVFACVSNSLDGSYTQVPNLPSGILTNQGGIPCGYFDPISGKYWTYVHSNISGSVVIRQATHSDFNSQLTAFSTVISGPLIGEPATTKTESPGFCINNFTTSSLPAEIIPSVNIFPNPTRDKIFIEINGSSSPAEITISDLNGTNLLNRAMFNRSENIDISLFHQGAYFLRIEMGNNIFHKKIIVL